MMFCFVGVPDIYVSRFSHVAAARLQGHLFHALPIRPDFSGAFRLNRDYLADILESLLAFWHGRPTCFDDGLGVIALQPTWDRTMVAQDAFFPFALVRVVTTTTPLPTSGSRAAQTANRITNDMIAVAQSMIRPTRAMVAELKDRMKRTPLLLPVRHFDADELRDLLDEVVTGLLQAENPTLFIQNACSRFERRFPFRKLGKRTGAFTNGRGIDFAMPGRALHGNVWPYGEMGEHLVTCLLTAQLRLGGRISRGFHYDCTRGGEAYSGRFSDCHEAVANYAGNPQLNVYPNDYIRGQKTERRQPM